MMDTYYAKSVLLDGTQPTVKDHLCSVAKMAQKFGKEIGLENEAYIAGMLHDFGKYSDSFQNVLKHKCENIDHAFCGATALCISKRKSSYRPIVEAINGHHNGLTEYSQIETKMETSFSSDIPIEANERKISALASQTQYKRAFASFNYDFPDFKPPKIETFQASTDNEYCANIESMLHTRMIFSCLVDADYTVSASDNSKKYADESEITEFCSENVLESLYAYRNKIKANSNSDNKLNSIRDLVFDKCGIAGDGAPGVYTLTAPTGTGKTLALMNFALRHCAKHNKKRIIIVLPFLSLTEQNAEVYRKIYSGVLEDHSQSNLCDNEREFSARWRVPVIITTSVKFFETLFSRSPSDCRKLHNIADSVIVFDEAQSLPIDVTKATLFTVNDLCRRYSCTMLFSTATQPDFSSIPDIKSEWKPIEILRDNQDIFNKLRRTDVEWGIESRIKLDVIAKEMSECESVCAIVNLRRHASKLYETIKVLCPEEEVFLITTDLCIEHRRKVIAEIKQRLHDGLPCRVVSTQCIEAGVDLDFEVMFRALAPLESVIQAAGRCNRNGKRKGRVVVFIPDEEGKLYPGSWYEYCAEVLRLMCCDGKVDINSTTAIKEYYSKLFASAKDKADLVTAIKSKSYIDTEQQYKLIDNSGIRIIVPYTECKALFDRIRSEIVQHGGITPAIMKDAAGITVSCYVPYGKEEMIESFAERLTYGGRHSGEELESDFYILRPQYSYMYSDDMGLKLEKEDVGNGFMY